VSLKTIIYRLLSLTPTIPAVSAAKNPQHEQLVQLLDRVHAEAIMPNADELARIFIDRDVAIVFYDIGGPDPATDRVAKEGARALGWGGGRVEVGRLTHAEAAKLADEIERSNPGDVAGIAWFRRHSENRLFALIQAGTFCFDFDPGSGFSIAPGTSDADWKS
jgi:hypothetical protein